MFKPESQTGISKNLVDTYLPISDTDRAIHLNIAPLKSAIGQLYDSKSNRTCLVVANFTNESYFVTRIFFICIKLASRLVMLVNKNEHTNL